MAGVVGFWPDFSKENFVLAPMEGVTDAPMRELLCETGQFTFAVSEFIRVNHEVVPEKVFYNFVPELKLNAGRTRSGEPVIVQLLGGHPGRLAASARVAVECGALGVDLNFGCPAQTVNRHDGGATLLKFPERIESIVSAVRSAVPSAIPVSAKLRLGWDTSESAFENVRRACEGGANWITLHARTRMQGYQPPVDWRKIGEVAAHTLENFSTPIIANGDIWTTVALDECRLQSGSKSFMLGRGAVVRPDAKWRGGGVQEALVTSDLALLPADLLAKLLPYFHHFAVVATSFGCSDRVILKRLKQWARMVTQFRGPMEFESLKVIEDLNEFFRVAHKLAPLCVEGTKDSSKVSLRKLTLS